jgi:hypothetical protein
LPIEFTEEEDEWNDWGGNGMHQIVIYGLSSMPSGSSLEVHFLCCQKSISGGDFLIQCTTADVDPCSFDIQYSMEDIVKFLDYLDLLTGIYWISSAYAWSISS